MSRRTVLIEDQDRPLIWVDHARPMAHRHSRLQDVADILGFVFCVFMVILLVTIADVR